MTTPEDEIRSCRELFSKILEEERRGDDPGRNSREACPRTRQILRVANDETFPERAQIEGHLTGCPVCRFTLRTCRAGLKGESTSDLLDPPDNRPDRLREYIISRRKPADPAARDGSG